MAFERLKSIANPTKDLINGYIRVCQNELFGDIAIENPYYNIPPLINNHCILFYEAYTWYKKRHGNGIEFLSNIEVVSSETGWSCCILDNEI